MYSAADTTQYCNANTARALQLPAGLQYRQHSAPVPAEGTHSDGATRSQRGSCDPAVTAERCNISGTVWVPSVSWDSSTVFTSATVCNSAGRELTHFNTTDVSEGRKAEQGTRTALLAPRLFLVYCLLYSHTLKMEPVHPTEISVHFCRTTRPCTAVG